MSVAFAMVRVPFEVVETIVEIERVSPMSESVSFAMMSSDVVLASSATVSELLLAVGAELVHEIVTVPVAILDVAPEASSDL